jgi:ribonuclease HII
MQSKQKPKFTPNYIIGIDEVGRGPLAGPVAVGAVVATPSMLRRFRDIKESKQLSPKAREEWYARIQGYIGDDLRFAVSFVSATMIDRKGIVWAIRRALATSLKKLDVNPAECRVLLDGGLVAPAEYTAQQTIIRGDASETVIAMASVMAKVQRDRLMVGLHKKLPAYEFSAHKGYGTKKHIHAIRRHGPSREHRLTFLTRIVVE